MVLGRPAAMGVENMDHLMRQRQRHLLYPGSEWLVRLPPHPMRLYPVLPFPPWPEDLFQLHF